MVSLANSLAFHALDREVSCGLVWRRPVRLAATWLHSSPPDPKRTISAPQAADATGRRDGYPEPTVASRPVSLPPDDVQCDIQDVREHEHRTFRPSDPPTCEERRGEPGNADEERPLKGPRLRRHGDRGHEREQAEIEEHEVEQRAGEIGRTDLGVAALGGTA